MAEDIWEPIRQGFRDIREGFKEARDSDSKKKQLETERLEKIAKIAKEQGEQAAKDEFVKLIGEEGESVFGGNTRIAQAAAKAGVSLAPFKKDRPRARGSSSGFDYSFMNRGQDAASLTTEDGMGEDGQVDEADVVDAPQSVGSGVQPSKDGAGIRAGVSTPNDQSDYNLSNMSAIGALESTQRVLMNKQSMVNQSLADGAIGSPEQARAATQMLKGTQNLLKATSRELSVRKEVDKNYKSAVDQLYKIDPGAASKVIDNFNSKIVPELEKAGVPVDAIDGRKQQFVVNYLNNLKTSKGELEAFYKTALEEGEVFDKNFKENERLYRFAATADAETLQKMLKDPNLKPFQSKVVVSALVTRMFQDQIEAKTGQNMSVLSEEQMNQLYTPAIPPKDQAIDVENISGAGERIRKAFQQNKTPTVKMRQQNKELPKWKRE